MTDLEKLNILGKKSQEGMKKILKDIIENTKELSEALKEENNSKEEISDKE